MFAAFPPRKIIFSNRTSGELLHRLGCGIEHSLFGFNFEVPDHETGVGVVHSEPQTGAFILRPSLGGNADALETMKLNRVA
jgi:hypothetical protein